MIDWLRTAKSAYFFKKRKKLPKNAIIDLFRTIRDKSEAPSQDIFRHVKEPLNHATWSAIAFFYRRDPAFLDLPDHHAKERICGFLLLVEHRDYAVLFKSNLDLPSEFKTEYFQRAGDERVEAAIAHADATFEQIRLRNMGTSKHALRSKTLEANNLQSAVGPAGASRYVPRGYRVRRGADHYTATPNTGRISLRSDRAPYAELVDWAVRVIEMLMDDNADLSAFIRTFARPIGLDSISSGLLPTYFAIDVPGLTEELFDTSEGISFVRGNGANAVPLSKDETDAVLSTLDRNFAVHKVKKEFRVIDSEDDEQIGLLNIGKTRISLRNFVIPEIEDIFVQPANPPADQEDVGVQLKRYIDRNDLFTVLFNDFAIVYLDGTLYRDNSLADGQAFLAYIKTDPRLATTTGEKGTFSPAHMVFDANSVFGVIVGHIANDADLLICDDLGDEWADFIGINGDSQPKTISFYHAKHGDLTLGASDLHILVSQAIKNLGRMNPSNEEIATKLPKWTMPYANGNAVTAIQRLVRGNAATLNGELAEAISAPDTIRRIFIVTSSLSRSQLMQTFEAIRNGTAPRPHFVQLYWLLMSYFSACTEVGAFAYVVCRE